MFACYRQRHAPFAFMSFVAMVFDYCLNRFLRDTTLLHAYTRMMSD